MAKRRGMKERLKARRAPKLHNAHDERLGHTRESKDEFNDFPQQTEDRPEDSWTDN